MDSDIKSYLSIIYGENVKVVFDNYVFTWEDNTNSKKNKNSKNGYIMAVNGAKLITEKIDDVIEIRDRANKEVVGYVVLLHKQSEIVYSVCKKANKHLIIKENVMVISKSLTFRKAKIQSKYYSNTRPELKIEFNFRVYTAQFNEDNEIVYFVSHS